jgi:hypothetical protein
MKISKAMTLLVLVYLEINASGCTKQDSVSAEFLVPIKVSISKEIENLACVKALSYPFSFLERSNPYCWNCDKLVEAGLLTKVVVEDPFASDTSERYRRESDVRLELTELGRSAYIPGDENSPYFKEQPHFCFGRAYVKEITRVYGPAMNGNVKMYGIRYIAELEDPNPFLLDPRAKLLDIPLPLMGQIAGGKTVLYPERNVTVAFGNPKDLRDFTLLDIQTGP